LDRKGRTHPLRPKGREKNGPPPKKNPRRFMEKKEMDMLREKKKR